MKDLSHRGWNFYAREDQQKAKIQRIKKIIMWSLVAGIVMVLILANV